MSEIEINNLIKKLKESILNLIKINYNIKHITSGKQLLLDEIKKQNKEIKKIYQENIYNPEIRFNKFDNLTLNEANMEANMFKDKIIIIQDVPNIKSSLQLSKFDVKAVDTQKEIDKIKDLISKKKIQLPSIMVDEIIKTKPEIDKKLNRYNNLKLLLKKSLNKEIIENAVNKIIFDDRLKNISISISILETIKKKIKEYFDNNDLEIEELIKLSKISIPNDIINKPLNINLVGGNNTSYYKTNEKYIVSMYYILYNWYKNLLLNNLIPQSPNSMIINFNLQNIITHRDLLFPLLKEKKVKNYFQLYIVYNFLNKIIKKFNDTYKKDTEYTNIYISLNNDNPNPDDNDDLELIKLIILYHKSMYK